MASELALQIADTLRAEMRTFNVQWFVDDAKVPLTESHDLTPYVLLAEKVLGVIEIADKAGS